MEDDEQIELLFMLGVSCIFLAVTGDMIYQVNLHPSGLSEELCLSVRSIGSPLLASLVICVTSSATGSLVSCSQAKKRCQQVSRAALVTAGVIVCLGLCVFEVAQVWS